MTAPAWKWIGGTLYEGDREILTVQSWGNLIEAEACATKIEALPLLYNAVVCLLSDMEKSGCLYEHKAQGYAALAAARREMP